MSTNNWNRPTRSWFKRKSTTHRKYLPWRNKISSLNRNYSYCWLLRATWVNKIHPTASTPSCPQSHCFLIETLALTRNKFNNSGRIIWNSRRKTNFMNFNLIESRNNAINYFKLRSSSQKNFNSCSDKNRNKWRTSEEVCWSLLIKISTVVV
jgi:hypothetical protein